MDTSSLSPEEAATLTEYQDITRRAGDLAMSLSRGPLRRERREAERELRKLERRKVHVDAQLGKIVLRDGPDAGQTLAEVVAARGLS